MTIEVNAGAVRGEAGAADRDFVKALGRRCVMTSVASFRPASEADAREAFDRLCLIVESQSHVTLIARSDGRRVGFLLLLDELPDEVTLLPQGFVAYMAVEPDARRDGVGAALLAAAEDEARRRKLPYMSLMVTEENEAARRLYDRAGYRTERRLLCKPL
ncbi:MAG TPA: GNAT family N-acetyltransferase [Candidatus Dormibacteraeota bacterium]|nr:GNAT family N-acetyltransferase [Candidatus Dormibacteraeota bacterium]